MVCVLSGGAKSHFVYEGEIGGMFVRIVLIFVLLIALMSQEYTGVLSAEKIIDLWSASPTNPWEVRLRGKAVQICYTLLIIANNSIILCRHCFYILFYHLLYTFRCACYLLLCP